MWAVLEDLRSVRCVERLEISWGTSLSSLPWHRLSLTLLCWMWSPLLCFCTPALDLRCGYTYWFHQLTQRYVWCTLYHWLYCTVLYCTQSETAVNCNPLIVVLDPLFPAVFLTLYLVSSLVRLVCIARIPKVKVSDGIWWRLVYNFTLGYVQAPFSDELYGFPGKDLYCCLQRYFPN